MIEAFWIPLLPPYLVGLILTFLVEALLTPRPVLPWRRQPAAVCVHLGVWTAAFALELALFRRPYFAVANVLAIELLIVLVSNAKFLALREPFVFPDFEYFTDAIKHPRLYLPFFGLTRAVAAGGAYGAALWAGLALENSVTAGAGIWVASFAELPEEQIFDPAAATGPFFVSAFGLAAAGLALALCAGRRIDVEFKAGVDLARLGLVAALWAYGRRERQSLDGFRRRAPFARIAAPKVLPECLPDLIAVQSESFFDIRRAYPDMIRSDLLANFDLLKSEAVAHGQLQVTAWGANTVRSEFGFLAGMGPDALEIHQYNPYRRLAKQGFQTIASYLKSLGYRTVCVHPYHRGFYSRDKVLPALGFDEFVGVEAFLTARKDGSYVGDIALADYVLGVLEDSSQPLYLHVITMENHGPLHWEAVNESDAAEVLNGLVPEGCEDLVAYARHLRNADSMFGMLRDAIRQRGRPGSICIFGDHVPIMPQVYRACGEVEGTTDYVIWQSDAPHSTQARVASVTALSRKWLQSLGLTSLAASFQGEEEGKAAVQPRRGPSPLRRGSRPHRNILKCRTIPAPGRDTGLRR
ncbi:LTA synthase family protein [Achromobacter sp. UBA4530]|uniref:LTA synthase family protein n=1 Tax=Achromobacter sp. UBA4530 TaxID=1945912 RepID=UPI00257A75AA|nr:LTA synthase family protein [Achromobacter sp. UBA4530]